MSMMQALRKRIFKPEPEEEKVDLPQDDQAWSEYSAIYSLSDFEKYNPDELINRRGYGVYRKMMMDEQVKAVVKFKRDAITSRDYYFELDPDKYGLSKEEAEKRIELSYAYIEQMKGSFQDTLNNIMSAIYNGFSVNEKLFKLIDWKGKSYWGIDRLKLKPFDTFYFKVDEYSNILTVNQKLEGRDQDIDLAKLVHYVHNPDFDEHYGLSELREAYRAWFSKDKIIKFRNIWLERHASGFRWVQPTEGNVLVPGTNEYTQLQNVMRNTQTGTSAIFPSTVEFKSDYPQNQVAYKEAIEDCDLSISRALLVPNLMGITPSGQTGSFSQSDTQLEAFFWTLDADANRLEDVLNEQLFPDLHHANFNDKAMPMFRFKAASEKKKMEVVNTWNELIKSGAAKHSDKDETHLRKMLEFPEAPEEEDGAATSVTPNSALSGQQVTSMIEIVVKVSTEELSQESAKQILLASFPITAETADAILKDIPEKKEPVLPAPGQPGAAPGGLPAPAAAPGAELTEEEKEAAAAKKKEEEEELEKDETILGKGLVSVSAFEKAMKRVDFAVIARKSEDAVEQYANEMGMIMGDIVDDAITRIKLDRLGSSEQDMRDIVKFKLDAKLAGKMRRAVKKFLNKGWQIGVKHSQTEIDRAQGEEFNVKRDRVDFIGTEFFDIKSFTITGKLTEDALAIIKNVLTNGAKSGKSTQEVINQIYADFATKGMISIEDARQALGEALNVANPDARLQTIVRTNTFEAINEARYSYFTDPQLGGFVEALEYSAILDSRTTQICQHLDGTIHNTASETWKNYRPPNHFNCRSLLIPVTKYDTWSESDNPTIEPQRGFE